VRGLPQYSKLFERRLEMIRTRCHRHRRNKPELLQARPGHLLKEIIINSTNFVPQTKFIQNKEFSIVKFIIQNHLCLQESFKRTNQKKNNITQIFISFKLSLNLIHL